jgi:hypothetical protein
MKSRISTCTLAVSLFAALAIPSGLAAQSNQRRTPKHHHYQLIDLGTLGGPHSYVVS